MSNNSAVGCLTSWFSFYSSNRCSHDLFRMADFWRVQDLNTGKEALNVVPRLDADGWPRWPLEIPVGHVLAAHCRIGPGYPAGQYSVSWAGKGRISFGGAVESEARPANNLAVLACASSEGENAISIFIESVDPVDPIRNIRLVEGADPAKANDPVPAVWRADVEHYGCLRFMNWGQIADNPAGGWDTRTTPTSAFWGGPNGVPVEHMIDVANALGQDMWYCFPFRATDSYVEQTAAIIAAKLDPKLKCYIEYTNEPWNAAWPYAQGHQYMRKQAAILWPNANSFLATLNCYALRSVQIFRICHVVAPSRFTRVLAGQASYEAVNREILGAPLATPILGIRPAMLADVFATAPYFGQIDLSEADDIIRGGVAGFLDRAGLAIESAATDMRRNVATAKDYGLPLVAYEGGHHHLFDHADLGGANDPRVGQLDKIIRQAHNDPRFGDLYRRYLDSWRAAGGQLFVHAMDTHQWSPGDYLGIKDRNGSAASSILVFDTVKAWAAANPPWWGAAQPPPPEPPPVPPPELPPEPPCPPSGLGLNEYQERTAPTAVYPREIGLLYTALGLAGETGEVAEVVKKAYRDDGGDVTKSRHIQLKRELGDVLWYLAALAREAGLTLEEIAQENLKKTASRQERGTLHGSGSDR